MFGLRRRDRLIAELTAHLADTREQLGAARERIEWYRAAARDRPLRAVPDQAPRSAARRTSK